MDCDIVIDLDRGDCAKAKVVHQLMNENKYDICLRISSGGNAGHTIFYEGRKFATHLIPIGVFHNIKSIIGCNCIVHPATFFSELNQLEQKFKEIKSLRHIDIKSIVKIDKNTFIVSDEHILEDQKDSIIGTTKQGIGPATRDKYARISKQAKDIEELRPFLIDSYEEFSKASHIICEGAQGFYLDINFSDYYPYVTSGHCTTAGALLSGISHKNIRTVVGCCKAYSTYVGNLIFHGEGEIFDKIQEVGNEVGTTTGRKRQCNFLNLDEIKKAAHFNGIDELIVSKMDVLKQVNCWKLRFNNGQILDLGSEEKFKDYILNYFADISVRFSYQPDRI